MKQSPGPPHKYVSDAAMLCEIYDRIVRIETRVVKLLAFHNLDASGDPKPHLLNERNRNEKDVQAR